MSLSEKLGFSKAGRVRHGAYAPRCQTRPAALSAYSPTLRQYSCTLFPSGDFTVGVVPQKKLTNADMDYERRHGRIEERAVQWQEGNSTYHETYLHKEETVVPPNFISGAKSSQRGRYGLKGITGHAKRCVRSAALMLQERWGLKNTGFATLTLPDLSEDSLKYVCAHWSEVVRQYFQMLRRHQKRANADMDYVCVTEIQQRRYERRHEVALHLHYVYQARVKGTQTWTISANQVRAYWERALRNVLKERYDASQKVRCNLQLVKRSASGYLGKYLSKGSKDVEAIVLSHGAECVPSSWWSVGSGIRGELRKRIIKSQGRIAEVLYSSSRWGTPGCKIYWCKEITYISESRGEVICGYVGRLEYSSLGELLLSG